MNDWTPTPEFEESIRQSFGVPEVRREFVDQTYQKIMHQAKGKAPKPQHFFRLRPAWIIIAAVLGAMVISTLLIGPQRVYAQFIKLFGYIPGVGFVNLDEVRVLKNAVSQQHEEQQLTVVRGLSSKYSTDLWLEFNGEAHPVDDAWLETEDGQRFELTNWNYSPDEPGTHGVEMHFQPCHWKSTKLLWGS